MYLNEHSFHYGKKINLFKLTFKEDIREKKLKIKITDI